MGYRATLFYGSQVGFSMEIYSPLPVRDRFRMWSVGLLAHTILHWVPIPPLPFPFRHDEYEDHSDSELDSSKGSRWCWHSLRKWFGTSLGDVICVFWEGPMEFRIWSALPLLRLPISMEQAEKLDPMWVKELLNDIEENKKKE